MKDTSTTTTPPPDLSAPVWRHPIPEVGPDGGPVRTPEAEEERTQMIRQAQERRRRKRAAAPAMVAAAAPPPTLPPPAEPPEPAAQFTIGAFVAFRDSVRQLGGNAVARQVLDVLEAS